MAKTQKTTLSLADAAAIPSKEVRRHSYNTAQARRAAERTLEIVADFRKAAEAELKSFDFAELAALPELLDAVEASARLLEQTHAKGAKVQPTLEDIYDARGKPLAQARADVAFGRLDAAKVRTVEKGNGSADAVGDLIALTELYLAPGAPAVPLSRAELTALRESAVGVSRLFGPKTRGLDEAKIAEQRDRWSTLFLQRYRKAEAAATWMSEVLGKEIVLPPLARPSRSGNGKPAAPATAPA